MANSSPTAMTEVAKAASIPQPRVPDAQLASEPEVDNAVSFGHRIVNHVGASSPQTPPSQYGRLTGQMEKAPIRKGVMLRKLQGLYGNQYVGRVIQAKRAGQQSGEVNEQSVQSGLRGGGKPLDTTTRSLFESRFGQDFGQVRIHTDTQAAESARAINARAYTVGQDVVFGAGQYRPERSTGQELLAHELAHTIQQRAPRLGAPSLSPHSSSEQAADHAAKEALHGRVNTQLGSTGIGIARQSLTFDIDHLNQDTLLDEIEKVSNRLKDFKRLTTAGRLEDEKYLEQLLAAFGRKVSDQPSLFGDSIVLDEARAVLRMVKQPRDQRNKLVSLFGIGFSDDVMASRAAQKLLESSTEFDTAERKELLTIAFNLMEPDTARAVLKTITDPRLRRGKKIRSGFERLSTSTREELLGILENRVDTSPEQRPSERPGIWGTGISRTGGLPYYIVKYGVTIDDIARYLSDNPGLPDILAQLNGLPREKPLKGGTLVRVPSDSATSPAAKRDIDADIARGRYIGSSPREGGTRTQTQLSDLGFEFEGFESVPLTENELRSIQQTAPQDPLFMQGLRDWKKGAMERDRQLAQRVPSPILSLLFPTSKLYFKDPRLEIQNAWYRHQAQVNLRGFEAGTNLARNAGAVGVAVNLLPLLALELGPLLAKGVPTFLALIKEELALIRLALQAAPKFLQGAMTTGLGTYYANPLLYNELGLIGLSAYIETEGDLSAILQNPFLLFEIYLAYLQGGASGGPRINTRRSSGTGQSTQLEVPSQPSSMGRTGQSQGGEMGGSSSRPLRSSIGGLNPRPTPDRPSALYDASGNLLGRQATQATTTPDSPVLLYDASNRPIIVQGGKASPAVAQSTILRHSRLVDTSGRSLHFSNVGQTTSRGTGPNIIDLQGGTPSGGYQLLNQNPGATVRVVEPGHYLLARQNIYPTHPDDAALALMLQQNSPIWPNTPAWNTSVETLPRLLPYEIDPATYLFPRTGSLQYVFDANAPMRSRSFFPAYGGRLNPQVHREIPFKLKDIAGFNQTPLPELQGFADQIYLRRAFGIGNADAQTTRAMAEQIRGLFRRGGNTNRFLEIRRTRATDFSTSDNPQKGMFDQQRIFAEVMGGAVHVVTKSQIRRFRKTGEFPPRTSAIQQEMIRNAAQDLTGLGEGQFSHVIRIYLGN